MSFRTLLARTTPSLTRSIHSTPSRLVVKEAVSAILHGSPAAKEEGEAAQKQHSKLVGRGKFVHEFQKHSVLPQHVEQYKKLIADYYAGINKSPDFDTRLVGSFEVIVGEVDTFVHIWEYEGLPGYESVKGAVRESKGHLEFFNHDILPLVQSRTSQLNQEFAFWQSSAPEAKGGIYELRSYTLTPGSLLEWEHEWRVGLEARLKSGHSPVGAWFSQIGKLHQVHHMWHYESLEQRRLTRQKAWEIDTWSGTVSKTVKLTTSMDSKIAWHQKDVDRKRKRVGACSLGGTLVCTPYLAADSCRGATGLCSDTPPFPHHVSLTAPGLEKRAVSFQEPAERMLMAPTSSRRHLAVGLTFLAATVSISILTINGVFVPPFADRTTRILSLHLHGRPTRDAMIAFSSPLTAILQRPTPHPSALERCLSSPFNSPGYLTSSSFDHALNRWNPFQENCTTPSLAPLVESRHPLPWLLNRTVVVAGVSVDRNHAHEFCEIVGGLWEAVSWDDGRSAKWDVALMGEVPVWTHERGFEWNLPHLCTIEEYGFMLIQTFHYVRGLPHVLKSCFEVDGNFSPAPSQGLADPKVDHWKSVLPSGDGEYRPGYFGPPIFEDRVKAHLLPLLDNLGRRQPDLIEVSASEWDIYVGNNHSSFSSSGLLIFASALLLVLHRFSVQYWATLPEYRLAPFRGNQTLIFTATLQRNIPHYISRLRSSANFLLSLFPTTRPILWRVPVELPARGFPAAQLANVVDQATRSVFLQDEAWEGLVELDETGAMLRGAGESSWYASASHPAKIPHAYVWTDYILWRLRSVAATEGR